MAQRSNTAGSIFQRTDGRWVAQVNLGWVNGKRSRKFFYAATRKEVQEHLTRALADLQHGLPVAMQRQTVKQYLECWLEESVKRECRPSTYTSYEQLVRLYIAPALGPIQLTKLTTQHIRTFLNAKLDSGLSSRTVQYTHAVLRTALNTALKDQLVIRNAAALVDAPHVAAKEVQPLTTEEALRFLEAAKGDRFEALFTVAVSLGLRQGEALALRWREVDLEAGKLRIRYALDRIRREVRKGDDAKSEQAIEIHLVEPKTKKSRRTIDLPQVTLNALVAHRIRQQEARLLAALTWKIPTVHCEGKCEATEDFVFTSSVGTPLDGCNITKRFQSLLTKAKIPHHRFHDLRHTAATLLAVQGVHPKTIQAVLGWDQLSMVDRYTHFVDEMRRDAANKMDAILRPVAVNLAVKPSATKPS